MIGIGQDQHNNSNINQEVEKKLDVLAGYGRQGAEDHSRHSDCRENEQSEGSTVADDGDLDMGSG